MESLDPTKTKLTQNEIKIALGKKASTLIEPGMLIGLGTGSTAVCFIESLGKRCLEEGLKIQAVSSSLHSLALAQKVGIPTISMEGISRIDLTIDGADEVDPKNRMIKGGGGAHVREKIIASSSDQFVAIVDETKIVNTLGKCGVPIEILPFGYHTTIAKISKLGYQGALRMIKNKTYITDNGNYIFDLHEPKIFLHPEEDHVRISSLPGVLDTGFFFNLPVRVLIGYSNGHVSFRS